MTNSVEKKTIEGKVYSIVKLTHDVIELTIDIDQTLDIVAGQWMGFMMEDDQGKLLRLYSIADYQYIDGSTQCVFVIKILESGRGSKIFSKMIVGDTVIFNGVFGLFKLQKNDNPKVFIATGTGLAPIMLMIKEDQSTNRKLYFGVAYQEEIYYEDKIANFPDLQYKIFVSREEVELYTHGRVNIENETFDPNTEFYICGSPEMVKDKVAFLKNKGFEKIYIEQY